jgi:hypothetical protein
MESLRTELIDWVQATLDVVEPGQFLLVEYLSGEDLPVDPYSQAALDPGGWYCEAVSGYYLPSHRWVLDELAMARHGWRSPDGDTDNWWRPNVPLTDAATLLVDALWIARGCTDQDRYAISVGTFPSGPDGGLPLPTPQGLPLAA